MTSSKSKMTLRGGKGCQQRDKSSHPFSTRLTESARGRRHAVAASIGTRLSCRLRGNELRCLLESNADAVGRGRGYVLLKPCSCPRSVALLSHVRWGLRHVDDAAGGGTLVKLVVYWEVLESNKALADVAFLCLGSTFALKQRMRNGIRKNK